MQFVSIGDNLHKMWNLFYKEKKEENINLSPAEFSQRVVKNKYHTALYSYRELIRPPVYIDQAGQVCSFTGNNLNIRIPLLIILIFLPYIFGHLFSLPHKSYNFLN